MDTTSADGGAAPAVAGAAVFFSPWDMEIASINFGAMCGHGAFAAALGMDVCHVMQFFPPGGGLVNMPIMKQALLSAGKVPATLFGWDSSDRPALTILQFLGSWMQPAVHPAARCHYRHWVATRSRLVWDCNEGKWLPKDQWEAAVIPSLMPRRGTGYEAFRSFVWPGPYA